MDNNCGCYLGFGNLLKGNPVPIVNTARYYVIMLSSLPVLICDLAVRVSMKS